MVSKRLFACLSLLWIFSAAFAFTPMLRAAHADGGLGAGGDAETGAALYEARCTGCHSLDANRVGPMHRGVFGRQAGSLPDYAYSDAVKASDVVWREPTLDRWLASPGDFIPGSKMGFSVSDPKERAHIIAYLKAQS